MAKVVENEPYWRYMCDGCDRKIEAEQDDVRRSIDNVYFVTCPFCLTKTQVPPMLLAEPVKRQAIPVMGYY